MGQVDTDLSHSDYHRIIEYTNGYSSADLNSLCKEAAMVPLREIPAAQLMTMKSAKQIRKVKLRDFEQALRNIRPSVSQKSI